MRTMSRPTRRSEIRRPRRIDTLNAIPAGGTATEPNPGLPQTTTYQFSYLDGQGRSHVATAWVTGEFLFGTGCVFIGQAVTTG